MPNAYLLFPRYLGQDGNRTVGGIQTYIYFLARELKSLGIMPIVVQTADEAFSKDVDAAKVVGIPVRSAHALWGEVRRRLDPSSDLVILCTEQLGIHTSYPRAVAIQHGVSWDIPLGHINAKGFIRRVSSNLPAAKEVRKVYQQIKYRRLAASAPTTVCVDYNFPNWLRATSPDRSNSRLTVIPNPVFGLSRQELNEPIPRRGDARNVRVLFARRFEEYRGVYLMAQAAKLAIQASSTISFTFAGEGPGEAAVRALSNEFPGRVQITRYESGDAVDFHRQFDIAVVPSLASEGTTLSVLEALAARCAVIASPIGGITNILIDGFNGRYFDPSRADQLSEAILDLAHNPDRRAVMAGNGLRALLEGPFNFDEWRARWRSVLVDLQKGSV